MPIVKAICPSCGATLDVDNKNEAAVCQYCGSAYIVEKAVNNYYNTTVNAQNLYAENLHVNESEADSLYASGKALIEFGEFEKAKKKFNLLSEKFPHDEGGWWGQVLVISKNLSEMPASDSETRSMLTSYYKAMKVSKDPADLADEFSDYYEDLKAFYYDMENHMRNKRADLIRIERNIQENRHTKHEIKKDGRRKAIIPYALIISGLVVLAAIITIVFISAPSFWLFLLGAITTLALLIIVGLHEGIIDRFDKSNTWFFENAINELEDEKARVNREIDDYKDYKSVLSLFDQIDVAQSENN